MSVKTLEDFPTIPMNGEQTRLLMGITLSDKPEVHAQFAEEDGKKMGFIGQVFYQRLMAHKVRVTLGLAVFLLSQMAGSPGNSTLWVWTLFNMQKDEDHLLNMDDWVNAFPMGVPSAASYEAAWDGQKGGKVMGNKLDDIATWVRKNPDEANDERFALPA